MPWSARAASRVATMSSNEAPDASSLRARLASDSTPQMVLMESSTLMRGSPAAPAAAAEFASRLVAPALLRMAERTWSAALQALR